MNFDGNYPPQIGLPVLGLLLLLCACSGDGGSGTTPIGTDDTTEDTTLGTTFDSQKGDSDTTTDALLDAVPRPFTTAVKCEMSEITPINLSGICPAGTLPCNGECLSEVGEMAGNCRALALNLEEPRQMMLADDNLYYHMRGGFVAKTDPSRLTTTCLLNFQATVGWSFIAHAGKLYFNYANIGSGAPNEYKILSMSFTGSDPVILAENSRDNHEYLNVIDSRLWFTQGPGGSGDLSEIPLTGGVPNIHVPENAQSIFDIHQVGDQLIMNIGSVASAGISEVLAANGEDSQYSVSAWELNSYLEEIFVINDTVYWTGSPDLETHGIYTRNTPTGETVTLVSNVEPVRYLAKNSTAAFYKIDHPEDGSRCLINQITLPEGTITNIATTSRSGVLSGAASETHLYLSLGYHWPGGIVEIAL